LLAACSVGDPYVVPQMPPPPRWTNADGTPAAWPSAEWWQGFGSARLDALMREAQAGSFDLAVAVAKVRQADALVGVAEASLFPSLNGSAGVTRARSAPAATRTTAASGLPKATWSTTHSVSASASYEVDFWGKTAAGIASAEGAAQASRFDVQTAILSMQSNIATTYFEILGLTERIRLARQSIRNAEEVLDVYRDRLAAGTATSLDVAQQESVLAGQRATLPSLEQSLRQNWNAIAILVGRTPGAPDALAERLEDLRVPQPVGGLPSELLARRPDIMSAEASLRAANADVAQARAAWFPSISLTGEAGFQSLDLARMMTAKSLALSFGPSLTVPIFDAGKIAGTVEQKRARFEELAQTYRKAVASAFSDVENALIATAKTADEVREQTEAEATARRAFEIARSLMGGGTVDISTVLNTQKTLFSAQDALAQARLAHLQAVVGLYKALGGGWAAEQGGIAP
jgi:NodT family efflux transporter outer membrane factor (OMF) lipoprotein